ncbi:hypothetical protein [Paractinoplanes atraurantiacus]|uniref:Uncharacterized protein n=1 Tax=Paractinoplanes atraurantiacus TaxID=1036182 RepID=A0A285GZI9_9ACTN|nr:hypothetical protein [Actinoplanes atraurantiacus]SNY29050.1 hypothetical protein SAMN05421748_103183 [Actinoplanes atraurantiacus]
MPKFVLQNVRLFTGSADLTTVNNKVEVKAEAETQDTTAFVPTGDVWTEVLAGLRSCELNAEGQWEALDNSRVDNVSFGDLGTITPWTICPAGAAVGALAYLTGTLRTSYELGGSVGDVAPWTADGKGSTPLVRGVIAHPPGTARTANGSGTAIQLPAIAAGQSLYIASHVQSVAGTTPSLTVRVESDDANGFASPTTQATFTAATGLTSQLIRVPGPITDTWWRAAWTITGTAPSFLFTTAFGIAAP